jgi:hypothetical protein
VLRRTGHAEPGGSDGDGRNAKKAATIPTIMVDFFEHRSLSN